MSVDPDDLARQQAHIVYEHEARERKVEAMFRAVVDHNGLMDGFAPVTADKLAGFSDDGWGAIERLASVRASSPATRALVVRRLENWENGAEERARVAADPLRGLPR